jgi:hypothetical protein
MDGAFTVRFLWSEIMDKNVKLVGTGPYTPASDLSRCCATCPNWEKREDVPNVPEIVGDCRFNIPTVMAIPIVDPLRGHGMKLQPVFPLMLASQWCANHPLRRNEYNNSVACGIVIK